MCDSFGKLTSSRMKLSLYLSLPPHRQTKQTKHTLTHSQGGETFTGRKKRNEKGGTFSQEVKGQGPLNQHFGPLKLTAITSHTHTHSHSLRMDSLHQQHQLMVVEMAERERPWTQSRSLILRGPRTPLLAFSPE